jgi:hypothetical protein
MEFYIDDLVVARYADKGSFLGFSWRGGMTYEDGTSQSSRAVFYADEGPDSVPGLGEAIAGEIRLEIEKRHETGETSGSVETFDHMTLRDFLSFVEEDVERLGIDASNGVKLEPLYVVYG